MTEEELIKFYEKYKNHDIELYSYPECGPNILKLNDFINIVILRIEGKI